MKDKEKFQPKCRCMLQFYPQNYKNEMNYAYYFFVAYYTNLLIICGGMMFCLCRYNASQFLNDLSYDSGWDSKKFATDIFFTYTFRRLCYAFGVWAGYILSHSS